jgi:hypothetical protein
MGTNLSRVRRVTAPIHEQTLALSSGFGEKVGKVLPTLNTRAHSAIASSLRTKQYALRLGGKPSIPEHLWEVIQKNVATQ